MDDRKPPSDLLDWMGIKSAPDWRVARPLGPLLSLFLTLLFIGAIAAAFSVIWHTVTNAFGNAADGPSLGAGAMIAALLGAPFVIWGTVLRHQTLRYQKEGHITDRITSAVEQLGAEKNVDRIGRPVTIWTGTPVQVSCGAESKDKYLQEPRSTVMGSEWSQRYNESTDEVWEGRLYDVYTWPTEKTIIQWQGEEVSLEGTDRVSKVGAWQVFTETVPNIEVRIGAILSLERIAQDSTMHDKGRDHVRVMEILCVYVRENSNATETQECPERPQVTPTFIAALGERSESEIKATKQFQEIKQWKDVISTWVESLPKPRADIAQALQVLGRRTVGQRLVEAAWPEAPDAATVWPFDIPCPELRKGTDDAPLTGAEISAFKQKLESWRETLRDYSGYRLDLRGANLQRANMSAKRPDGTDAVFSGALLQDARMEGADLREVHMQGTILRGAHMNGMNLRKAHMVGAILREARAQGTNLRFAQMTGADLHWVQLEGATLRGVRITGADMRGTRINGADLRGAKMEAVNLGATQMEATELHGAKLDLANLRSVVMDGCTSFAGATLQCALLCRVNFEAVQMSAKQIDSTFGDASVILPEGLPRPIHWPDKTLKLGAVYTEWRKWRDDPEGYVPPPAPAD